MALTDKLSAIGDAIREKTGGTAKLTLDQMPVEIAAITTGGGGGSEDCNGLHIPEEQLVLTGDCRYKFSYNNWNWFIEEAGDKITSNNITNAENMFSYSTELTEIPFDLNVNGSLNSLFLSCSELEKIRAVNYTGTTGINMTNMFRQCYALKEIGKLKGLQVNGCEYWFQNCLNLRYLPELDSCSGYWGTKNVAARFAFAYCYSLRSIPDEYIKIFKNGTWTSTSYHCYYSLFAGCNSLDEVNNLCVINTTLTSNMCSNTFLNCSRLKNFTFETNADGTPITVSWNKQTIDLSTCGYSSSSTNTNNIISYNSGITTDKQVKDDATYQALKNDPDWYTTDVAYSRYNHDSAVATINSLPNASSGTNTIKFTGASGTNTDGGAISNLTEEEIAVATAKGWTVSLV